MKIDLTIKEIALLIFILSSQLRYGWESCLGGFDNNDKRAIKKYEKEMKMVKEICEKLK